MFRCQVTGEQSKPREKATKLVSKTRPKSYTYFVDDPENFGEQKMMVSNGTEIVEELTVTTKTAQLVAEGKLQLRRK